LWGSVITLSTGSSTNQCHCLLSYIPSLHSFLSLNIWIFCLLSNVFSSRNKIYFFYNVSITKG
jgi:hypothetical protein